MLYFFSQYHLVVCFRHWFFYQRCGSYQFSWFCPSFSLRCSTILCVVKRLNRTHFVYAHCADSGSAYCSSAYAQSVQNVMCVCAADADSCAVQQLVTIPGLLHSQNAKLGQEEQLTSIKRPTSHITMKNKVK
jgi:hypothetical protein